MIHVTYFLFLLSPLHCTITNRSVMVNSEGQQETDLDQFFLLFFLSLDNGLSLPHRIRESGARVYKYACTNIQGEGACLYFLNLYPQEIQSYSSWTPGAQHSKPDTRNFLPRHHFYACKCGYWLHASQNSTCLPFFHIMGMWGIFCTLKVKCCQREMMSFVEYWLVSTE